MILEIFENLKGTKSTVKARSLLQANEIKNLPYYNILVNNSNISTKGLVQLGTYIEQNGHTPSCVRCKKEFISIDGNWNLITDFCGISCRKKKDQLQSNDASFDYSKMPEKEWLKNIVKIYEEIKKYKGTPFVHYINVLKQNNLLLECNHQNFVRHFSYLNTSVFILLCQFLIREGDFVRCLNCDNPYKVRQNSNDNDLVYRSYCSKNCKAENTKMKKYEFTKKKNDKLLQKREDMLLRKRAPLEEAERKRQLQNKALEESLINLATKGGLSYLSNNTKDCFFNCTIHGEITKKLKDLSRHNEIVCKKCSQGSTFAQKGMLRFGHSVDYSMIEYRAFHQKLKLVCKKHGEFYQSPAAHLSATSLGGCPICLRSTYGQALKHTTEHFINKAKLVWGDTYDYSNTIYDGDSKKVIIKCQKHGDFLQRAGNHLQGNGCKKCPRFISKAHQKVIDYLLSAGYMEEHDFTINDTERLKPTRLELDIYFPSIKLAIEVDGVWWHCHLDTIPKGKVRENTVAHDQRKNQLCEERGIKLLRFTDIEINKEWERVCSKIEEEIQITNILPITN